MRRAWGVFLLGMWLAACSGAATPTPPPAPTLTVVVPTRQPPTATLTAIPATNTAAPTATTAVASATQPRATQGEPTEVAATATPTPDPAVEIIYRYLEARAAADVELTTALSCPAWRPQAVTEAISFRSMNAKLQDVNCETTGALEGFSLVACQGTMLTTYGPDTREWDLSNQVYRAALEAGAWTMCGYQ